jgi:hypothetical protein
MALGTSEKAWKCGRFWRAAASSGKRLDVFIISSSAFSYGRLTFLRSYLNVAVHRGRPS